jgi:hypothetical protein
VKAVECDIDARPGDSIPQALEPARVVLRLTDFDHGVTYRIGYVCARSPVGPANVQAQLRPVIPQTITKEYA